MKKRLLVLATAVILLVALFIGCAPSNNPEVSLVVLIGNHANAKLIPRNAPFIKNAIFESCYTYGMVSFIAVDGDPQVYYQADIPEPEVKGLSQNKKQTIANAYVEQLLYEMHQAYPRVPEVDTLKAIQQAALVLQGSSESSDKVMVIMDSGLATAGYLDFTKGLLDADAADIVEALEKLDAIPDLTGVKIVWMFNGQTAKPQEELSESQKKSLQEIWREILVAGGAMEVEFTADVASDIPDSVYPYVSTIEVESREIDVDLVERASDAIVIEVPVDTVVLDNTSVQFIGDTAIFVDVKSAEKCIELLAKQLLAHPDNRVYVIGTTASGNPDFCKQLSMDRAQAVVNVLVNFGVSETQLIPMGLGFEEPWHIDDLDENGRQIEALACQNRKVLVVDINSEDAKKIH